MSSTSQCSKCSAPVLHHVTHGLCETCFAHSTNHQAAAQEAPTQSYAHIPDNAPTVTVAGVGLAKPQDITQYHAQIQGNQKNVATLFEERYEVLHSLGTGGMGEVWKAFDRNTERFVAIKYIKSAQFQSIEYNRFLTEARAMANLNHDNVLRLYDFSVDPQRPYMVLEFVDGQSLAAKLGKFKKAPLPYLEVARIMEAASRGVQCAHDCNVLHRDLKPSNIMLANDGTVKVLDFGLAKRTAEGGSQLTLANTMVGGTPGFTAPEQVKNEGVTAPQTDVWGLGATLYALLAGSAPFPTGAENLGKVLTEPLAPLRNKRLGTPAALEAIAMKCLAKDPAQRYATAKDVADELGRFQRGEPVDAKPIGFAERLVFTASRVPRSTWLVMLLLLVVVASGATLATLPKRTILETEQDQLRAGQGITIIGDEHPEGRTFRSFFEPNTLSKSMIPKTGSNLKSNTLTLCELTSDPGNSQYIVEGEFRYREDYSNPELNDPPAIGLYFDHQQTTLQDSSVLSTFYSVTFHDKEYGPRLVPDKANCSIVVVRQHFLRIDQQGNMNVPCTSRLYATSFDSATKMPTEFKKIAVEVQPDLFRIWWDREPTGEPTWVHPRHKIDRDFRSTSRAASWNHLVPTGDEKPAWSPRHGVGLYCERAHLGIMNFKLSPPKP
jgi:serine/threonine protein kinase